MSTELYQNMLEQDYGHQGTAELMEKVWSPTPFMVDAFTGHGSDRRDCEMQQWCYDTFGEQSSPIHEREGTWCRGNATIFGWTWYGFAERDQLDLFLAHWRDADWVREHDLRQTKRLAA